ncbi:MAG: hypothetical protein ACFFD2_11615 [Promethearchaeota archaeon]
MPFIYNTIEWEIPKATSGAPFLDFNDERRVTRNSHGQIQMREIYDFFQTHLKIGDETFKFKLRYKSVKDPHLLLTRDIRAAQKGQLKNAYAIYLIRYFKELIKGGYLNKDDLKPGNKLKFSYDSSKILFELSIIPKITIKFPKKIKTKKQELIITKRAEIATPSFSESKQESHLKIRILYDVDKNKNRFNIQFHPQLGKDPLKSETILKSFKSSLFR